MIKLHHYPLDPFSRRVRLNLGEFERECELIEEKPWDPRPEILKLNPGAQLPVLICDDGTVAAGVEAAASHVEETRPDGKPSQIGSTPAERAEARRLVAWFDGKFHHEVSAPLLVEKVVRRFVPKEAGGGPPNMDVVRAALARARLHLDYIGQLTDDRNWLAGDDISIADFSAASHLSVMDYLGDVPWSENDKAKAWYQRIKSRPGFRTLLADRIQGISPPRHYDDLDF